MLANQAKMGLLTLALYLSPVAALNPSCAPGGNFNLNPFVLQLPSGSTNKPDQIPASRLVGCNGYKDTKYFFTEAGDGAMCRILFKRDLGGLGLALCGDFDVGDFAAERC
ncbi:hypothetical protein NQ176_g7110 [Zarea fungicola]|uniref:Uncharacterized protein n=1 Tax=Zarea fungicola TaxID=93591 RepID=A0ACC1N161_9HYPO|nr:hypothetical protein NQ176_g7110 [Lecanicillium fungicola]